MATFIAVPSSFSFFGLSFSNFSRYLKALVYFSPAFSQFFSLNCALPIALRSSAISILFGMVKSWISSGQIGYLSPVPSSSNFWALWTYFKILPFGAIPSSSPGASSPHIEILQSFCGFSPFFSIFSRRLTVDIPFMTLPNTTCLPSKCGVGTVVIKNFGGIHYKAMGSSNNPLLSMYHNH